MSSQRAEQQQPEPKKTPPGYRITHVRCCYNCLYFDAHWCSDGDNDTCAKYAHAEIAPNGICDSFVKD